MALHTNRTVGLATLGSPSPRPSPLGRGRTVHRLSITTVAEFAQQLLAEHTSEARCSLSLSSLRERVRVRGNGANDSIAYRTIPGTVELDESSRKTGGCQNDNEK